MIAFHATLSMWWRRSMLGTEKLMPELPSFKRRRYEIYGRYPQTVISRWHMKSCLLLTPFGPGEAW